MSNRRILARAAAVVALSSVVTVGTMGIASAQDSKDGPSVWNSGIYAKAAAKFFADTSPNGTGDTIRISDYDPDGYSAVAKYNWAGASYGTVWNSKGAGTDVYAVLGGGAGVTEGVTINYTACIGKTSSPTNLTLCGDYVSGVS
ncbi:hypothetical protein KVH15_21555 [Streptomyces olivaceus]|uniref:hypothetical protein n=1 Tax=Streptomyces olivaceus TaxID=47716 RepID=UPI001CC9DEB7|nr:hypothetical protein [Streptomyces olivaceus]MBZ6083597.1 hypothetical protein [Streptomyces olivaceus]